MNLYRVGSGYEVIPFPLDGYLVGWQQPAQLLLDFFDIGLIVALLEESLGHLAQDAIGIGNGDAGTIGDAQSTYCVLDGGRAHFLASHVDQFLFAAGKVEITGRITVSPVARVEPVAIKTALIVLG